MWQRFTDDARKAIFYAQEEAENFGEGYVSTEHVLLGLCREPENTACKVIVQCKGSVSKIEAEVKKQLPRGDLRPSQDMTLTPRAKRVIDLAYDEARALGNNFIGTEHLLLGLIKEGDGLAGRVLAKAKIELKAVQNAIREIHKQQGMATNDPTPTAEPTPPRVSPMRVRYDLQLLHPADQLLLAILSDEDSEFSRKLRTQSPNLTLLLPSILAVMAQAASEERPSFTAVLADAHRIADEAGKNEIAASDLFHACLAATVPTVRNTLFDMGLQSP